MGQMLRWAPDFQELRSCTGGPCPPTPGGASTWPSGVLEFLGLFLVALIYSGSFPFNFLCFGAPGGVAL